MFPFIPLGDRLILDSWRLMLAVGILGGSLVSWIVLQREIGRFRASLLVPSMAVSALLGAHLAHYLLHPGLARWDLHRLLVFWSNGHSLIGAPAVCVLVLLAISRLAPGISFWQTADAFSLGTPIGLFFARIGCYMKGCCWGIPIEEGHPFHGLSVKLIRNDLLTLHPVQLYSAAAALAIFCTLLAVRSRQKTPGLLTVLLLLLYAPARFFLEFFRGDTEALLANLTLHQWICTVVFLAGALLLYLLLRRARRFTLLARQANPPRASQWQGRP
jgi:phosphatidylglycerol:prolipoprotein diacylglycerol transferase